MIAPYLHLRPSSFVPPPPDPPDPPDPPEDNDLEFYGMIDLAHEDYGAIYDDDSAPAIAANDAAIQQVIDELVNYPDPLAYGAAIRLRRGHLFISETIVYPKLPSPITLRPVNFGIIGDGVTSRIVWRGAAGGRAIEMINGIPNQYTDHACRWVLKDLTVDGGELIDHTTVSTGDTGELVYVEHGAKFTEIQNVRITNAASVGIRMMDLTGGSIINCYSHQNSGHGIVMEGCIMMQLHDFRSRSNAGHGIWLKNYAAFGTTCNTNRGDLYAESNGGIGVVMENCTRSELFFWLEANGSGFIDQGETYTYPQLQARNCTNNTFSGQMHEQRKWDMDVITQDANIWATSPMAMPHITGPLISDDPPTVEVRTIGGTKITAIGNVVTFAAGAFIESTGSNKYVEITSSDIGDDQVYATGDWVEVDMTLQLDAAMIAFLGTTGSLAVVALADTTSSINGVQVFSNGTARISFREYFPMIANTWVRLFLTFVPSTNNASVLTMTVLNCDVRFCDNTP